MDETTDYAHYTNEEVAKGSVGRAHRLPEKAVARDALALQISCNARFPTGRLPRRAASPGWQRLGRSLSGSDSLAL